MRPTPDGSHTTSWGILGGVVLVLLCVGWWWLQQPATPDEQPAEPRTAPRGVVTTAVATADEPEQPSVTDSGPRPFEPRTVLEEAALALATASGGGVVVCPLPTDLPEDAVVSLMHRERQGHDVVGGVREAAGASPVWEDGDFTTPIGWVAWEGAWVGERATCWWEEHGTVRLSGRIEGELAGRELGLRTSPNGSPTPVDGPTFELDVERATWLHLELTELYAYDDPHGEPYERWSRLQRLELEPVHDLDGLVLDADPDGDLDVEPTDFSEMAARHADAMQAADPFDAALDDDGLSAEARAQLETWREERDEARVAIQETLEHILELQDFAPGE